MWTVWAFPRRQCCVLRVGIPEKARTIFVILPRKSEGVTFALRHWSRRSSRSAKVQGEGTQPSPAPAWESRCKNTYNFRGCCGNLCKTELATIGSRAPRPHPHRPPRITNFQLSRRNRKRKINQAQVQKRSPSTRCGLHDSEHSPLISKCENKHTGSSQRNRANPTRLFQPYVTCAALVNYRKQNARRWPFLCIFLIFQSVP